MTSDRALDREGVRDLNDRRRIAYWRYTRPGNKHPVGAVSPKPDGYRALGYGKDIPTQNEELGLFPTRARAERAVEAWNLTWDRFWEAKNPTR